MESEPLIDLHGALAALEGDRELLMDCLALLAEDLPLRLEELRRSLDSGDLARACNVAHTIKGSVAVVGAVALKNTALALEVAGRGGRLQEADACYAELCRRWRELCLYLEKEKLL
ncbi:Hpt domain-containing protein [Geoalkalibacter sp.]|uniref:Hpt domain-containing protein n=1 Tax=Geoalkalibacter sp. TaxID=3041440 RepID=UPI00272ED4AB|nr:Hpt domain-containing protein [Geoalkalibacter sp.]